MLERNGLSLLQKTNQDWGSTANLRSKRERERGSKGVRESEESRAGDREIPAV